MDHVCLLACNAFIIIIATAPVEHYSAVIDDIHSLRTHLTAHLV